MKKKKLLCLLGIAAMTVTGFVSCGGNDSSKVSQSSTPVASSSEEVNSSEEVVESSTVETRTDLTRAEFLDKIDELAAAGTAERAAKTTFKVAVGSATVNGQKLPTDSTGELPITNGKVTLLGKEFTVLLTKASFQTEYFDGVTAYNSETYGFLDGALMFNVEVVKDSKTYRYSGGINSAGILNAARGYEVDSEGKKTTIWWLAPGSN